MILTHPDTSLEVEVAASAVGRYQSQGWREKTADAPKGNASLEDWRSYALSKGFTAADVEGKSRDDLRAALS